MCKAHPRLKEAIALSRTSQRLILENDKVVVPPNGGTVEGRLVVSSKRTLEAASAYARTMRTCVLNFASASNPGGGVVNGSSAQEEALCRCSTLYFNLNTNEMWSGFYFPHRAARDPIHNDDAIYTPRVTVFKGDTAFPTTLPESEWYEVDVISCAAPNLREHPSNPMNSGDGDRRIELSADELRAIHERRLTRILDIAAANGEEAVILGAFGCGAFRNDPNVVSTAAAAVVPHYRTRFKVIEFAVFCRPGDTRNYDAFKHALG
jgi:uncharacterized protein (TIGR02452 family)